MEPCPHCHLKEADAVAAWHTVKRLQETVDKLCETVNKYLAGKPDAREAAQEVIRWMEAGQGE